MGLENTFKFLTQNNLAGMCIFEGQEEEFEFKGFDEIKLNELESLNGLMLEHNKLKDISPLKELKELKEITSLDLHKNQITDISPLKEFINLQYLHIDSNPVPVDQIEALKQALPKCTISH
jgi:hypothetical protein